MMIEIKLNNTYLKSSEKSSFFIIGISYFFFEVVQQQLRVVTALHTGNRSYTVTVVIVTTGKLGSSGKLRVSFSEFVLGSSATT